MRAALTGLPGAEIGADLSGVGSVLRAEDLHFGRKPVVEFAAAFVATEFLRCMGAEADLLVQLSGIGKSAGSCGALGNSIVGPINL